MPNMDGTGPRCRGRGNGGGRGRGTGGNGRGRDCGTGMRREAIECRCGKDSTETGGSGSDAAVSG